MKKSSTILVVAAFSGLVGAGAGYFLGRSSVPAAASPPPAVVEERTVVAVAGQEATPGASVQNLDPKKSEKLVPLTAATLRAELANLESGGFSGGIP